MPERIQLSRKKGFSLAKLSLETNGLPAVSVARPGRWGNPHFVSRWRDAATCVALFENTVRGIWNPATSAQLPVAWNGYDEHQSWLFMMGNHPLDMIGELRGKNLACWCRIGEPCHADTLLNLANDAHGGST